MKIFTQQSYFRIDILLRIIVLISPISLFSHNREEQFSQIYSECVWGKNENGEGTSGYGSLMTTTETYRIFLVGLLKALKINSVVDAGCGDWGFSQAIDWSGIDYMGFDIVKSVVERDNELYSSENVHFFHLNFIENELPPADLLICKDVLQHLPNEDVASFIKQFKKYKYCLITNDVDRATGTCKNKDTHRGIYAYRHLDITKPPFNVVAQRSFTYDDAGTVKLVLLIKNDE